MSFLNSPSFEKGTIQTWKSTSDSARRANVNGVKIVSNRFRGEIFWIHSFNPDLKAHLSDGVTYNCVVYVRFDAKLNTEVLSAVEINGKKFIKVM